MTSSVCPSCRTCFRARLRTQLGILENTRRGLHHTTILKTKLISPDSIRSLYWNTDPPSARNLASARNFFLTHSPRKHWTATEWRKQNEEPTTSFVAPEVVFLGRSNVGKSSLLNAILHAPGLNRVGSRPGKTTTMHAWGLAPSDPVTGGAVKGFRGDTDVKMAVLDMPGYGHGSRGDWGNEIIKYLQRRKQLRRAFLLLHAEHGVKDMDRKILALLRTEGISHQIIATKCDTLTGRDHLQKSLWEMQRFLAEGRDSNKTRAVEEIIAVGGVGDGRKNDRVQASKIKGVDTLQWAVLQAAGLADYASNLRTSGPQNATQRSNSASIPLQDQPSLALTGEEPTATSPPSAPLPYKEPPSNRPSNKEPPPPLPVSSQNPKCTTSKPPMTSSSPPPSTPGSPTEQPKFSPHVGGMAELLATSQPRNKTPSASTSASTRPSQPNARAGGRRRSRTRPRLVT